MDSVVVKCAFCFTRHLITLDGVDTWFVRCRCGAQGFTEDEAECAENRHSGPGFTARHSQTSDGTPILLSDPLAVFVDEWARCWYVSWYIFMEDRPGGPGGVRHPGPGEGGVREQ